MHWLRQARAKAGSWACWHRDILPALRRFQLFSAPIPSDFISLKEALGARFSAEYQQLMYDCLEDSLELPRASAPAGCGHILVGNSATASNNHVVAFDLIERVMGMDLPVLIPLSYGDIAYGDLVEAEATRRFARRARCVRQLLPSAEYKALLADCSTAVFGHRQQQGLGNILMMLYAGSAVILDRKNPVHDFLGNLGVTTPVIDGFGTGPISREAWQDVYRPPSDLEATRNALLSFWGRENVRACFRAFFKRLGE